MQIIRDLVSAKDKIGTTVKIKHINEIGNSPVMLFYLREYAKLIEAGMAHPMLHTTNNTSAVYAEINDQVVGIIIYRIEADPLRTTWKILSAVDSEFQQRGIYQMIHFQLEKYVKTQGSKKIASHVHVTNMAAHKGNRSVGLEPVWYKMEKNLTR
jgi:GNAT superfamily N-acetyltransferase